MRLIDADELWKKINSVTYYGCSPEVKRIRGLIEDAPTVNAKPVKLGRWEKYYFAHVAVGAKPFIHYCSRCTRMTPYPTEFCPHCGASMLEVEE